MGTHSSIALLNTLRYLLLFCALALAKAAHCSSPYSYSISAGTFVANVNKAQVSDSGAAKTFELTPYVGAAKPIGISGAHFFMPEFALAYYLDTARNIKKRIFFLKYNFGYFLNSQFLLRYGISTYWQTVEGEGSSLTLRNGSGYSEFPSPDETITSYFSTVDFGFEFFLNPARSARFDLNLMNAAQLPQRSFNYILSYNWYF